MAITPNEEVYVPDYVEKIINIGDRIIDPITTVEILIRLNLITEQEVRYRLIKLRDHGHIDANVSRAGSKITNKGIDFINRIAY